MTIPEKEFTITFKEGQNTAKTMKQIAKYLNIPVDETGNFDLDNCDVHIKGEKLDDGRRCVTFKIAKEIPEETQQ